MSQSGQYYGGSDRRGSGRPQFDNMTVGDYANGMPNIRIGVMIRKLIAQMIWVMPLTIIGGVIAWFLLSGVKRTYTGEGRVLVQLGSEYVYDSVTNQSSQGLLLTPDIITLNDVGIMKSPEVVQMVKSEIEKANLQQLFAPGIYADINSAGGNPAALMKAELELQEYIERSYEVSPQPKSSIVDLSFKHEDGAIAVQVTEFFIKAYLKQRQAVFVDGSADVISDRRAATEDQLRDNDEQIQTFLNSNRISDFDTERAGATTRLENSRVEISTLKAELAETEAALATVENQLRETPREINLYVDDRASQRVAQAELELKTLLSRYLPTSDPVRAKQAEISELKSLQNSNGGAAIGGRRVGANTVYQELMTRRNLLQSTADAYREKEFALQRQLNSADAKVQRLQKLSPAYQALLREQSTLEQRHRGYTAKEQEALINQRQADAASENVKVLSLPELPRKGRNMRAILTLLIAVGWGCTLFMIALLKVFLDPKLYSTPNQYGRRDVDERGSRDASGGQERRAYQPETYIPEPVPAVPQPVRHEPEEYVEPPSYAPVPYDASGNTAYELGTNTAYDVQQSHAAGIVPVIGTVPSNKNG